MYFFYFLLTFLLTKERFQQNFATINWPKPHQSIFGYFRYNLFSEIQTSCSCLEFFRMLNPITRHTWLSKRESVLMSVILEVVSRPYRKDGPIEAAGNSSVESCGTLESKKKREKKERRRMYEENIGDKRRVEASPRLDSSISLRGSF